MANALIPSDDEIIDLIAGLYRTKFFRMRPECTPMFVETIRRAILSDHQQIRLFYLWGIHEKGVVGIDDYETMDFLSRLIKHLSLQLSVDAVLTVVSCDTHAAVNRVDPLCAEHYASEIDTAVVDRGWDSLRMSALWSRYGISLEKVDELAEKLNIYVYEAATIRRLTQFASKYYRGTDANLGARRYIASRLLEQSTLIERFYGYLHMTSVEPALKFIQPDLPTIFIWTQKRGCIAKPWFSPGPH